VVEALPAPVILDDETVEEADVVDEVVATVVEEEEEEASAGKETVMDVVMDPFPVLVVLVEMVTGPAVSGVTTEAVTETPVDLTVVV